MGSTAQAACTSPKNDLFLNPFNKNSAHHRPIGSRAVYASSSHPATRDWLKAATFGVNVGTPFGTDAVATDASDPRFTIAPRAICDRATGLPVTISLPTDGILTTLRNNTGGCPDGDVVVFDRVTNQAHHLRQFQWNDGEPTAGQYRAFDVRGLGHGTRPLERLGMAATGVAGLFGVLRGYEINTADHRIEHALRMGLPRKPGCKIMLSRQIVLPATSGDTSANSPGNNTGHIPYGGLLALPPTVNILALGMTAAGTRFAQAVKDYGIYVGDGGGCTNGALEGDQSINPAIKIALRHDIEKLYPHIRLVLNNDVLGSPVAGGGVPRGDNCAFDAP